VNAPEEPSVPRRRRPRYRGSHPRSFAEKYKEHNPDRHPDTIAKVLASGKTPAGTHIPIMVGEICGLLQPAPGRIFADCTLGYGGHARAFLEKLRPGGLLIGLDADPLELPRTEARLREAGFDAGVFRAHRSNYAGLPAILAREGLPGVDGLLADLGLSSMQIDRPERGFSVKFDGPLDMRMNPHRGLSASAWIAATPVDRFATALREHADEPRADILAAGLAGQTFHTTGELAAAVRALVSGGEEAVTLAIRRVFQAVRIAVNDEFTALDMLLRHLPACLNPGGCACILTFHSGEDRRVKKAFQDGLRQGLYSSISDNVIRPTPEECRANPRAKPAKLRWARRTA
jgi:16S rRNA (cytosine1402-N4)-methyltransferase